jgi:hypothetical protein
MRLRQPLGNTAELVCSHGVVLRPRDGSACCLSRGRFRFRGAALPQTPEHNGSASLKSPEEYRALAAEALREAETVAEGMRLGHIRIAQLWLELADKVTQLRLEIAANATLSGGSPQSEQ